MPTSKNSIALSLLMLWSGPVHAQVTTEYNPSEFQSELQTYLGAKAEGVNISPMFASSVTDDIKSAIGVIAETTDYIVEQVCSRPGRPTKITLNLTAGFKLVFEANTGSSVEWDLEKVCPRTQQ